MGLPIRYRVPYRITVKARDIGSGKSISNAWYFRCSTQLVAPPAYGGVIAGSGDTTTFLTDFITAYAGLMALLNANYVTSEYICDALIGNRYKSPSEPISGVVIYGGYVEVTTATPHGLVTGDLVNIFGVTTPAVLNALWAVTVINSTKFSVPAMSLTGPWSANGYWQVGMGQKEFVIADTTIEPNIGSGGIVGQALPLFAAASIRRLNTGVGRNFRSRVSLSPMSEADSLDGGWIGATKTAWATALNNFYNYVLDNGGTDAGSSIMADIAVSGKLAMGLASPFTQSDSWVSVLTGYLLQPNCGSIVRRKPKLTAIIT